MHIRTNHLLTLAILLLAVIAYLSVSRPLRFDDQRKEREQTVQQRLVAIREAAEHYRADSGRYARLLEELVEARYLADSLRFIPYSQGETFSLKTSLLTNALGEEEPLMECGAEYAQYLKGLSEEEITALTEKTLAQGAFPGLRIGSLSENNQNAGNWE